LNLRGTGAEALQPWIPSLGLAYSAAAMAPKKGDAKAAKAAEKARAESKKKLAEDKTFGLKNKNKSKVVQNYVKQVHQHVPKDGGVSEKKKKKDEADKMKAELDALLAAAIVQPKVPPGVDPKSVMCEFYKKGKCTKGFKCKFSHNEATQRKGAKAAIYADENNAELHEEDGMEDWDQETLEKAVKQKHGTEKPNQTKIICKHFIEAIEKKQYGWFWVCPGGGKDCQYRHALPAGYVLKSQMKQLMEEELANKKSIEEEIEEERSKVDAATPLSEEVFRQWREKKMAERREKEDKAKEERIKAQRYTGRELFAMEGFVAVDDNSASDTYERDSERDKDDEAAIKDAEKKAKEAADQARAQIPQSQEVLDAPSTRQFHELPEALKKTAVPTDEAGPSEPPTAPLANLQLTKEEEELFLDEDDDGDLDDDELEALEESLKSGPK